MENRITSKEIYFQFFSEDGYLISAKVQLENRKVIDYSTYDGETWTKQKIEDLPKNVFNVSSLSSDYTCL